LYSQTANVLALSVYIFPAMSKILESLVKKDLEGFLDSTGVLPGSQHGFRPGRSCTTALGTAQTGWLVGLLAGKVVGVIAYDLSAAFDTVIPKLERIGVRGSALTWFADYLRGGSQCVVWNGEVSGYVKVAFGVRQGSILGPILFLISTADLTEYLGTKDSSVVYADDSNAWCIANTWAEVMCGLEVISDRFACWAKGNGLVLNASKTQVLISAGAGKDLVVNVDGKEIRAVETLELHGVQFDCRFATTPHLLHLAKATT
jgi:hypothetical protein